MCITAGAWGAGPVTGSITAEDNAMNAIRTTTLSLAVASGLLAGATLANPASLQSLIGTVEGQSRVATIEGQSRVATIEGQSRVATLEGSSRLATVEGNSRVQRG